jgi:hypothetical protein
MKPYTWMWLLLATGCTVAPKLEKNVTVDDVSRIINTLASDEMQGRRAFTPAIDKAADFIADEFRRAGLQQLTGVQDFKQQFEMVKPKLLSLTASINGAAIEKNMVVPVTAQSQLQVTSSSGFKTAYIANGSSLYNEAMHHLSSGQKTIVFVDTTFGRRFRMLARLAEYIFLSQPDVVFVLHTGDVNNFSIDVQQEIEQKRAENIVGILPGKTKPGEYVIFSGHYDHIGIGKPVDGDSIYNGANDDASGVTAVIMAAKHFAKAKSNERTLVFAAFTAEELGGFGSKYFSQQMDPAKVVAMFNLEMIGTESKWGKNSAFITGFNETDMGKILQKNLEGSGFTFQPDPYLDQQLFYRSDNATLARLGVPAHTISTSKMDVEPNYHKVTDEVATLDLPNMTAIIKAVITSSASIVNGTDTPTRVNTAQLEGRK